MTATLLTPDDLARRIRSEVLRMTHAARSGHVGSNLSIADILAVLYTGVLRVDPARPEDPRRDRLVLSKGHACASLYAALAHRGFFPVQDLQGYGRNGSLLWGHVSPHGVPGVEAATGSLGHGLPIAAGMALAAQRDDLGFRAFTILSDGECDEGSVWEAAMFAGHHRLDNLVAIVDYNHIQSIGRTEEILDLEPFRAKWEAFGWAVRDVDGHDLAALGRELGGVPWVRGRPSCLLAHTVKGKGVGFMEDQLLWHYRSPTAEDLAKGLAEIEGGSR